MPLEKMICGENYTTELIKNNINGLIDESPVRGVSYQERLVAFGNSITASSFNFALWLTNSSDGGIVYQENLGVNGDTTQMMIDRLDQIPNSASMITVMEGTNDAGNSVSPVQHAENVELIINYAKYKGLRVILILAPPRDSAEQTPALESMNLFDYVTASKLGVECFEIWDSFTNPSNGFWIDGASSDGTHPTPLVQQEAGELLFEKIKNKQFFTPLPRRNDQSTSLSNNCCFLSDSSGNGSPDGWTTYGGGVRTLVGSDVGNMFVMSDVGSGTVYIQQTTSSADVVSGKRYLVSFKASATINSGSLTYYISTPDGEKYAIRDASKSFDKRTVTFNHYAESSGSLSVGIRITEDNHDVEATIERLSVTCLTDFDR